MRALKYLIAILSVSWIVYFNVVTLGLLLGDRWQCVTIPAWLGDYGTFAVVFYWANLIGWFGVLWERIFVRLTTCGAAVEHE